MLHWDPSRADYTQRCTKRGHNDVSGKLKINLTKGKEGVTTWMNGAASKTKEKSGSVLT